MEQSPGRLEMEQSPAGPLVGDAGSPGRLEMEQSPAGPLVGDAGSPPAGDGEGGAGGREDDDGAAPLTPSSSFPASPPPTPPTPVFFQPPTPASPLALAPTAPSSPPDDVYKEIEKVLEKHNAKCVIADMVSASRHPVDDIVGALVLLVEKGNAKAIPPLLDIVTITEHKRFCISAVEVLGHIAKVDSEKVVAAILSSLEEKSEKIPEFIVSLVTAWAASGLRYEGGAIAAGDGLYFQGAIDEALVEFVEKSDAENVEIARVVLRRLEKHEDKDVRYKAGRIVAHLNDTERVRARGPPPAVIVASSPSPPTAPPAPSSSSPASPPPTPFPLVFLHDKCPPASPSAPTAPSSSPSLPDADNEEAYLYKEIEEVLEKHNAKRVIADMVRGKGARHAVDTVGALVYLLVEKANAKAMPSLLDIFTITEGKPFRISAVEALAHAAKKDIEKVIATILSSLEEKSESELPGLIVSLVVACVASASGPYFRTAVNSALVQFVEKGDAKNVEVAWVVVVLRRLAHKDLDSRVRFQARLIVAHLTQTLAH